MPAPFTTPGRAYALALHDRAAPEGPRPELRWLTYRLTSDYTWQLWESSEPILAEAPGEWCARGGSRSPGATCTGAALSLYLRPPAPV